MQSYLQVTQNPVKMAFCQIFLGYSKDKHRSDIGAF